MSALHDYRWLQREAELQRAARLQRDLDRDAARDRARIATPHSEDRQFAAFLLIGYGIACAIAGVMTAAIVWSWMWAR